MSATGTAPEVEEPYASEPLKPSTLALDRRRSKLEKLSLLRQQCIGDAGILTIDHEVDQVRAAIRAKALDEDFSVAVRERWQTWSRNSNPFRSGLSSSAATELGRSHALSESESDLPPDGSTAEDPIPPSKRRKAFRANEIKVQVGTSELDVTEGWETIRQERESRLRDLDAALPKAFRFEERQLQVYAHRLKPKYINSLDRPFETRDVRRLLRSSLDHSPSAPAQGRHAPSKPHVFDISFFSSSLNLGERDAATRSKSDSSGNPSAAECDYTRDGYVKHICGDGLAGMKRTQTVELLSTHTLSDLQDSLFCWSDEQPERQGWHRRLKRQLRRPDIGDLSTEAASLSQHRGETAAQGGSEEDESVEGNDDARFAQYTGERRQTDTALIIEGKLYSQGMRHGDAPHEADYATLIRDWNNDSAQGVAQIEWSEKGGSLGSRLDQINPIRIGQPYWILHQGDCVHCFVVEQVRALRPSEESALDGCDTTIGSVESLPKGTVTTGFPRVTWLSTPSMLRFASDNKEDYGLGHRILYLDGLLPFSSIGAGLDSTSEPGSARQTAWQIAMGRTKRKEEGLLRKKQGKCLACSLRKAQVGILGGDRVHLPPSSGGDQSENESAHNEPVIDGLDDHLVAICTSCAAILGFPTRQADGAYPADARVELDWQRISRDKDRNAGWTVFPLY